MIDSTEQTASASPPTDFHKRQRRSRNTAGMPAPNSIDRLPPHEISAEQGVLACVLLSPTDSMGVCIEKFKRGSEVFYDLRHQQVYDLFVAMYDLKQGIDLIPLQAELKNRNQLEAVGGLTYLSALMDCTPSAANLEYY